MKTIQPRDFNENVYRLLNEKWCLVSACSDSVENSLGYNAMTASWGGFGVLWNKNVFFCFIRPQRYTKQFIDSSDKITLSFFGEEMKKALSYCGSHSGREGDKLKEAGFNAYITEDGTVEFKEAQITVTGKKLFAADMKESDFIDKALIEKNYPASDYHTVYVCEIESIKVI